ncbi:uncharacterized protein LOC109798876 [Cajanus cajan]|uniref:uncharacterized protein LOC109798876 n=1 Tax=Cajanus cajan TaxID=3821 RepID=UPI00098D9CD0|nr:uncharacterized protein LOC109798876 [Cajanus cajan]
MRESLGVMWRERALLVVVVLLTFLVQHICATKTKKHACNPSSCGTITNIHNPFRLKDDPKSCGVKRYELACENNVTVLYLFSGKYHVQAINYNNSTIRVADPGVQQHNCSSLPRYFFSRSNFSPNRTNPYYVYGIKSLVFLNCSHPVNENLKYVKIPPRCLNWHSKGYHIYAIGGDVKAKDIEVGCRVKLVAPTSWWGLDTNKSSYPVLQRSLVYGFEISYSGYFGNFGIRYYLVLCASGKNFIILIYLYVLILYIITRI